jgi:MFS family permease
MMISDLAGLVASCGLLIVWLLGDLEPWHLYVASVLNGTGQAFQWPAYSAAIAVLVPKQQYGRANGMMTLGDPMAGVLAPPLGAVVLAVVGLEGVLLIDIATSLAGLCALACVTLPARPRVDPSVAAQRSLFKDSVYGFAYIFQRPPLLALQLLLLVTNLFAGATSAIRAPMILARTGSNHAALAAVQSAGALGAVTGGFLMSAWGGPTSRVRGIVVGQAIAGCGLLLMGVARELPLWVLAAFVAASARPVINTSNQTLWHSKVAPDLQGRVFATRRLIAFSSYAVAPMLSGPLSDFVLEPAMRTETTFRTSMAPLVDTGPGSGMAVVFLAGGALTLVAAIGAHFVPRIRDAERLLPDHDVPTKEAQSV